MAGFDIENIYLSVKPYHIKNKNNQYIKCLELPTIHIIRWQIRADKKTAKITKA